MFKSLYRISISTLTVGLLALGLVTLQQVLTLCSSGQSACLVAAVTFSVPDAELPLPNITSQKAQSTVVISLDEPSLSSLIITFIQVTSIYLILMSVIGILVAELFELRYLKQIMRSRKIA